MLFNSIPFVLFFLVVVVLYYLSPQRFRWVILLAASYLFYMSWQPSVARRRGFRSRDFLPNWPQSKNVGNPRSAAKAPKRRLFYKFCRNWPWYEMVGNPELFVTRIMQISSTPVLAASLHFETGATRRWHELLRMTRLFTFTAHSREWVSTRKTKELSNYRRPASHWVYYSVVDGRIAPVYAPRHVPRDAMLLQDRVKRTMWAAINAPSVSVRHRLYRGRRGRVRWYALRALLMSLRHLTESLCVRQYYKYILHVYTRQDLDQEDKRSRKCFSRIRQVLDAFTGLKKH